MKRIGIIGANGFIGRHLYKELLADGHTVYGASFPQFDVRFSPWPFAEPIDILIIASHLGSVDDCKVKQTETYAVNVTGVIRILEEATKRNVVPVYLSSNMVFAGERADYREDEAVSPLTEYGKQKAEVEAYIQQHFSNFIITRLTKIYSGQLDEPSLVSDWVTAWRNNKSVLAIDDMVISPVLIDDLIKIFNQLIDSDFTGVLHIGGPEQLSVFDLALACVRQIKGDESLVIRKKRADFRFAETRPPYQTLNTDTLQSLIIWPLTSLPAVFARLNRE